MDVPEEHANSVRHMTVRDPYERLSSIYRYLRRRDAGWGVNEAKSLTFGTWITYFLALRKTFSPESYNAMAPSIWLATQAECWAVYRGQWFWKLEELQGFLTVLNIDVPLEKVNATPGVVEFPVELLDQVWDEWAGMDCVRFGYKRRT